MPEIGSDRAFDSSERNTTPLTICANPGADSRKAGAGHRQAQIPYQATASIIKHLTPLVLIAPIDRRSPQELTNNLSEAQRNLPFTLTDLQINGEA